MDERTPAYYAVIPADVRYDDQLSANAKLLYGEISALVGKDGYCFASNAYFAELYQLTERTISGLISKLQKQGYLVIQLDRDDTGQILSRRIYLKVSSTDEQPLENIFHTPRKDFREGIEKNFQCTDLSNTVDKENIKESSGKKSSRKKSVPSADFDPMPLFVEWINQNFAEFSRDDKNALYLAIADLVTSRKENGCPIKSKASVTAMCNRLMRLGYGTISNMIDLLSTATSSGWRTVYPPGGQKREAPAANGRKWECL